MIYDYERSFSEFGISKLMPIMSMWASILPTQIYCILLRVQFVSNDLTNVPVHDMMCNCALYDILLRSICTGTSYVQITERTH